MVEGFFSKMTKQMPWCIRVVSKEEFKERVYGSVQNSVGRWWASDHSAGQKVGIPRWRHPPRWSKPPWSAGTAAGRHDVAANVSFRRRGCPETCWRDCLVHA